MTIQHDITEELPLDLTGRGASSHYVSSGQAWDCAIGGLPFLLAISDQRPFRRQTAQFRTERVDNTGEPSEQSLDSGVWSRSRTSYHYGAGQPYQEPLETSTQVARYLYNTSSGLDPWTPGELRLLKDTEQVANTVNTNQTALGVSNGVLHVDGSTLTYRAGSNVSVAWGGSGVIQSMTVDGKNYYVADNTGIYSGALPASAGSKVWDTGTTAVTVRFVKARLMAGIGNSLYELVGGTPPTLPDPLYTHPVDTWVWTDISEGPAAIYAAGYCDTFSAVYEISTQSDASGLNPPVQVVEMPRGERVVTLYGYLGTFMGVGTSKGFRVAELDGNGNLTLGPLIFESASPINDMVGSGSWLYVGASDVPTGSNGKSAGVYRVDLATEISQGRFAYAPDQSSKVTGTLNAVTVSGDVIYMAVSGQGLYRTNSHYVAEGWLRPGRAQFSTLANKVWRSLRAVGKMPAGTRVSVYASATGEGDPATWYPLGVLDSTSPDETFSITPAIPAASGSLYLAIRLSTTDTSNTPVLTGTQVRALPSPERTRLIQVPLMCFDFERDRTGLRWGSYGGAYQRMKAVEDLEQESGAVTFQDFTTGERLTVTIEEVDYLRTQPPSKQFDGAGGILTLTLRTA